jgi:AraC-like DNA-binding protein
MGHLTGIGDLPDISQGSLAWVALEVPIKNLDVQARDLMDRQADALEKYGNSLPHRSHGDPQVQRVLSTIAERFADGQLTRQTVAHSLGLKPWRLAYLLKKWTDLGFLAHVHRRRVMGRAACWSRRRSQFCEREMSCRDSVHDHSTGGRQRNDAPIRF